MTIFSIALRGGVILEELILRMSLSGRAILHRLLPGDYILSYAPCRGSVSWEIHFSKRVILEQLIFNIAIYQYIKISFRNDIMYYILFYILYWRAGGLDYTILYYIIFFILYYIHYTTTLEAHTLWHICRDT